MNWRRRGGRQRRSRCVCARACVCVYVLFTLYPTRRTRSCIPHSTIRFNFQHYPPLCNACFAPPATSASASLALSLSYSLTASLSVYASLSPTHLPVLDSRANCPRKQAIRRDFNAKLKAVRRVEAPSLVAPPLSHRSDGSGVRACPHFPSVLSPGLPPTAFLTPVPLFTSCFPGLPRTGFFLSSSLLTFAPPPPSDLPLLFYLPLSPHSSSPVTTACVCRWALWSSPPWMSLSSTTH